jgi:hypothetical protein
VTNVLLGQRREMPEVRSRFLENEPQESEPRESDRPFRCDEGCRLRTNRRDRGDALFPAAADSPW